MSEQAAPPDLFARKGHAGAEGRPVPAKPSAPDLFTAADSDESRSDREAARKGDSAEEAVAPASLSSINLKRGNGLAVRLADDNAGLASVDAGPSSGELERDGAPPAAQAAQPQGASSAHGPFLALLAVACFALGFWYTISNSNRAEPDSAAVTQAEDGPQSGPPSSERAASGSVVAEFETPLDQQAARQAGDQEVEAQPEPEGSSEPGSLPRFGLIRIEANGEAVIAGRAVPDSELILLDNGEPIGKVKADWAGEWAFIPTTPIAPGDHEFSLVIVTPQGTVAVPGVGKPEKGSSLQPLGTGDAPNVEAKAIPHSTAQETAAEAQSPAGESVGKTALYAVQLSSTTSWKGAEQEWLNLQRSFPELLGDKQLVVHKAELDRRGTWYRVRTGDFAELASARKFCSALRAKRQDCLVIKR
jgi:hypothetical protein